ncbi:hypothetical protein ACSSUR_13605 [Pseudomonas cedrina]|uniref:hypothetical protein n=1 Tax=Pseudomonas cedrina TaxID=651740 RepID=UPI003EDB1B1A
MDLLMNALSWDASQIPERLVAYEGIGRKNSRRMRAAVVLRHDNERTPKASAIPV